MPLETSRVQTPYRGVRGIRVRPAPGSQTFTGHELVARMLPVLERTGWEMHASVFIQGLGWRSVARWVSAQELSHGPLGVFYNMNTYEMADYGGDADEDPINLIEDATIYLRPPQLAGPQGGSIGNEGVSMSGRSSSSSSSGERTDCFQKALQIAFAGQSPQLSRADFQRTGIKFPCSDDRCMKQFLGLPMNAKVPLARMPDIEKALRTRINVFGFDEDGPSAALSYTSTAPYGRVVNLKLFREHFSLLNPGRKPRMQAEPGRPRMHQTTLERVMATAEPEKAAKASKLLHLARVRPYSSPVFVIPTCHYPTMEAYEAARQGLLDVCKAFKEPLDLDCFAGRIKEWALEFFRRRSLLLPVSPELTPVELAFFCGGVGRGGLVYAAQSAYEGPAIQLDYTSFYASVMMDRQLNLPTAQGEERVLDELPRTADGSQYASIGLYRAVVSGIPEAHLCLWDAPYERPGVFTQIDISTAVYLGGRVTLVQDGKPNCLQFARNSCVAAADVFRGFVGPLFAAKSAAVGKPTTPEARRACKQALNMLAGALYERKVERQVTTEAETARRVAEGDLLELPSAISCIKHRPGDSPETAAWVVESRAEDFTGPFPRLGCYITSKGRNVMARALLPAIKAGRRLLRCHTDGFLLEGSEVPAHLAAKIGSGLGQLKIEKQGHCVLAAGRGRPQFV
eukprot:m.283790 g.283790  ORF g.283790 m.283790 type:complete len:683 (+) comp11120_c0_seq5:1918-3966(+)